jgi:hypothetical protein
MRATGEKRCLPDSCQKEKKMIRSLTLSVPVSVRSYERESGGELQCSQWLIQDLRNLLATSEPLREDRIPWVDGLTESNQQPAASSKHQAALVPEHPRMVSGGRQKGEGRHTQFLWPSKSDAAWSSTCCRASSLETPSAKVEASACTWFESVAVSEGCSVTLGLAKHTIFSWSLFLSLRGVLWVSQAVFFFLFFLSISFFLNYFFFYKKN